MNAAVTRDQAREFRVAAGLPIEWEHPDGVPEPPIDRIERTRQALDFLREALGGEREMTPQTVLWQRMFPIRRPAVVTDWLSHLHFAVDPKATLGQVIAEADERYESQWSNVWRFGIAPAARRNCETELATIAAKISRKPITDFPADAVLADCLTPRQGKRIDREIAWRTKFLFLSTTKVTDAFSPWTVNCVVQIALFLIGILLGIVTGSWLTAALIAVAGFFLGQGILAVAIAWPVWTKPYHTIADIAGEMHDQVSRRAEEMLAAASPNAAPATEPATESGADA